MKHALIVQGITKRYPKASVDAVSDLSFALPVGSICGFIGPNGAGKTTTMRICSTLEMPDSGDVFVGGYSVLSHPDKVRQQIGFMPDAFPIDPAVLVCDMLEFFGRAHGLWGEALQQMTESVVNFTNLTELLQKPFGALSKGMKQRAALATVLMHDPQLLILDEPNKLTHRFTVSDIDRILSAYDNPNSYKTYRRGINTFFNWAKRFHYCLENPCDRLDRPPSDTSSIAILSLDEVKRLLKLSTLLHDGSCAASVAILLYAGLRPSELQDLKPENIKDGYIRVTGGKLRRKLKRSVPIVSILKKWLKAYPFQGVPDGWSYKQRVLRKSTKAERWVSDVIRHTSISYQLERDRDEGRVAFNNGTSAQMINQHYRDVIDDEEMVEKFWSLTPSKLSQVEVDLGVSRKKNLSIKWPSDKELKKLVWEKPLSRLSKDLGVSDSAIRKRCKKNGIGLPKNGHWQRQKARGHL